MNTDSRKRVVVADDHSLFRQGLVALLEREGFNVVGEASDGHEAIRLVRQTNPSFVLLDFSMPLLNGIEATREILKRAPDTHVLLLTMYDDEVNVLESLRAGVRAYILKNQTAMELEGAIREVLRGSVYLSPGISEAVVNACMSKEDRPIELLTDRERQVLQLIAEGHTTKSIASVLYLSVKTAESHRTRIMQRLGIHNIASLVRYAIRRGMIKA